MKLNLYAIHDKLAGNFSNPFALDERIAMRTFSFMAKERAEIECMDREIVKVGEWDNETGELVDMYSHYNKAYNVVFDMAKAKRDLLERERK